MRSGIEFSNDDFSLEMATERPRDPARFILAKPLASEPGARFDYRDADPHLLALAIREATGRTLGEIAGARLFEPMGITAWTWERDASGASFGPYGLYLRPRDLARFGRLILDHGMWEGRPLVPAAWVEAATSAQSSTDPDDPEERDFEYGFYWWIVPEMGAFTTWGHGGTFVFIVPARDLVIVFTAEPDTNGDTIAITLREFLPLARRIVAAIRD
jgi:CubicO group peptidase (beta-lactamase class C family)